MKTIKRVILGSLLGATMLGNASYAQIINTFAGNGTMGAAGDGTLATAAELKYPGWVCADPSGNIYISDAVNQTIRKVNTSGIISLFAGNGVNSYGGDHAQATNASMSYPAGVCADPFGNIYIADNGNMCVRKVNTSGVITTFAGQAISGYSGDNGPAVLAELFLPNGLVSDDTGNIYIADGGNYCVRKVNTAGVITTIAGDGTSGNSGDYGPATAAHFGEIRGLAIDKYNNLYLVDDNNSRVRKVNMTTGIVTPVCGTGTAGLSGDGGPATSAAISGPSGIAIDTLGNVYIADYGNNRIRVISSAGDISTYAGTGVAGFFGDGGPASNAEINNPWGIALDSNNNLYIADQQNNRVRIISANPTDIPVITFNQNGITSYPNPSNGTLWIDLSSNHLNETIDIQITDINGNIINAIKTTENSQFKMKVDVATGLYVLTVATPQQGMTKTILISK